MTNLVREVAIGQVVNIAPEFITDPTRSKARGVARLPEMGAYLTDCGTAKAYTAFFKGVSASAESLGVKRESVIHYADSWSNVLYLDPVLEVGDRLFVEAMEFTEKDNIFYSKKWGYNAFIDGVRNSASGDTELVVHPGDFLGVFVSEVQKNYNYFKAIPLLRVSKKEYDLLENRIVKPWEKY